eukprot:superscaffoldBa00000609_g6042
MGNRSSETRPFKCVVMDKVTAQLYACTFSVCMCEFSPADVYTTKTKGDKEQLSPLSYLRSHPSELDLTLEDRRGPVVHSLTLDGSKAPLLCSGSQRSGWTHQAYCKWFDWPLPAGAGSQGGLLRVSAPAGEPEIRLSHEKCPLRSCEVDQGSAGANTAKCPGMAQIRQVGSEDEGRKGSICWKGTAGMVYYWITNRDEVPAKQTDLKPAFRLCRNSINMLVQMLPQQKAHGWSHEIEVLVTVYWLACGASYRVIDACCILHNICVAAGDILEVEEDEEGPGPDDSEDDTGNGEVNERELSGNSVRGRLFYPAFCS